MLRPNQGLVQEPDIHLEAHRHIPVHGGLEFQEEIDVKPVRAPAHAPDEIVLTVVQIIADVALADAFQGRKVNFLHPGFLDKPPEQVFHHTGMREQELVAVVVFHDDKYRTWWYVTASHNGPASITNNKFSSHPQFSINFLF